MDAAENAVNRPTLSLCMIVKDEEKLLPTALKSAAPWVDEIIVVDTGSRDATVDIAKSHGAKVFHDPWVHNMALHRNHSLQKATGDWILIMDADEELDQKSAPIIGRAMAGTSATGYLLNILNELPGGQFSTKPGARLFRNLPDIRFQGRVHAQPSLLEPPGKLPVTLYHRGYNLDAKTKAKKIAWRLPLLEDWLADEPNNYLAHLYMANHLLADHPGREKKALDHALTAFQLVQRSAVPRSNWPKVLHPTLVALDRLGLPEEIFRMAQVCEELFPTWPDPLLAQALGAFSLGHWHEVCRSARRFMALQDCWRANPDDYPYSLNTTQGKERTALYHWLIAAAHLGLDEEAALAHERLLKQQGGDEAAAQARLELERRGMRAMAERLGGAEPLRAFG